MKHISNQERERLSSLLPSPRNRQVGRWGYIYITKGGRIAARNQNYAVRYFLEHQIDKALTFRLDKTVQRRDHSAERYERKRRMFEDMRRFDPTFGHLGWIAPEKFGDPRQLVQ